MRALQATLASTNEICLLLFFHFFRKVKIANTGFLEDSVNTVDPPTGQSAIVIRKISENISF